MVKSYHSRRGRCPHRPEGSTIERLVFRTYPPIPFGRVRDDVGIVPYAVGEAIPSILPRLNSSGVPSTPAAAAAPSPSRRGRGLPPAGAFPYLPLGEGTAAAAEEGRYQVGFAYRPTPVRAFGPATLSQERVGGPSSGVLCPNGMGIFHFNIRFSPAPFL